MDSRNQCWALVVSRDFQIFQVWAVLAMYYECTLCSVPFPMLLYRLSRPYYFHWAICLLSPSLLSLPLTSFPYHKNDRRLLPVHHWTVPVLHGFLRALSLVNTPPPPNKHTHTVTEGIPALLKHLCAAVTKQMHFNTAWFLALSSLFSWSDLCDIHTTYIHTFCLMSA